MSNNKQSSIEWLIEKLEKYYVKNDLKNTVVYQQAKAMHKEEIENAYNYGQQIPPFEYAEQYYNETFGGNNEQQ